MAQATARSVSRTLPSQQPRDSQTLTLPDGRLLGYSEYGIATGTPILYLHGFPSSRLETAGLDRLARRRNLRIFGLDRPGFGLSSPQPGRRIIDYPADVSVFAKHVGLNRFAVVGGSGGGPYAIACARAIPSENLSAVGVLAGGAPWVGPEVNDYTLWYRATRFAALYLPWLLRPTVAALVGAARWLLTTGPVIRWIDGLLEKIQQDRDSRKKKKQMEEHGDSTKPPPAQEEAEEPKRTISESRDMTIRGLLEAYTNGAGPTVQEAQLLTQDWGMTLSDVAYDPVLVWHGSKDTNSPTSMIRWMAQQMPHARLREFEGATHFDMDAHLEEIFDDLLYEIRRKESMLESTG